MDGQLWTSPTLGGSSSSTIFDINPYYILLCFCAKTAVCQPCLSEAAGALQTISERMWPAKCHKELASHFMKKKSMNLETVTTVRKAHYSYYTVQ